MDYGGCLVVDERNQAKERGWWQHAEVHVDVGFKKAWTLCRGPSVASKAPSAKENRTKHALGPV